MSRKIAEELLPRLRQRYTGRGREGRSRLIDELCEQWSYSRKHAIKLLGARAGWGGNPGVRKRRPLKYDSKVEGVLWRIWKVAEQPCGKMLKALLPQWLPHKNVNMGGLGRICEAVFSPLEPHRPTGFWLRAKPVSATEAAAAPSPEGY